MGSATSTGQAPWFLRAYKVKKEKKEIVVSSDDQDFMSQILARREAIAGEKKSKKFKKAAKQVIVLNAEEEKAREAEIAKKIADNKEKAATLHKQKQKQWEIEAKKIAAEEEVKKQKIAAEAARARREQKAKERGDDGSVVISGVDPVLHQSIVTELRSEIVNLKDQLGSNSNVRKKRSLEDNEVVETKDQSTSIEDLLVLENDLSDEGIENWEFDDEEFAEDTNSISTTDSEEVAIDDSSKDSPTTSTNAVINTEVLSEGVDEIKAVALNNEIHNINKKAAVEVHHVKAIIDVASASYAMPHNIIKNRLLNDGFMPIAVAAGEEDKNKHGRTGIWTSAGYSISKQGNFSNHLPYKSRMAVMTIGGDIALGDSSILGIAYSNAKANLKFNSLKGKSRINSHILSIYSQHDLQHNFYLQLVGSAASSTIKSKIEGENKKKSYVDNISLESNLTYCHSFSNGMQLLPTIGLKYNYLRGGVDKGQKLAKQTIIVNHKHERILSSHFGTKVIFNPIEFGSSLQLTPTMHAGLERRMIGGRKIIMASITTGEGAKSDVRVEMPRVVKNKYNFGVGLIAQSRNVKLQLDYNYSLQKSYKAHEGGLKLKVSL